MSRLVRSSRNKRRKDAPRVGKHRELRRKIEAAGVAIVAGVDLSDVLFVERVASKAFDIILLPATERQARRVGFSLLDAGPARPKSNYQTNQLAAAGYHILRAGIDPGIMEPAIAIGALSMALRHTDGDIGP
ncbi:hypothetical protein [Bosea sp. Root670]|uniref:hypothetical protein n=1 Tax=Bosea sp. Root670 TaxID=1736583 RepID=UPI0012E3FA64|nr:hypothetical protein [Bosea sp. Root670]